MKTNATSPHARHTHEVQATQAPVQPLISRRNRGNRNSPVTPSREDDTWVHSGMSKHIRYLSAFSDDVIVVEGKHRKGDESKPITIDLNELYIGCVGGDSIYQSPQPLSQFPHLCEAFKLATNSVLFRNESGSIPQEINSTKAFSLRIFAWMMRNGIYKLAELTPKHLEEMLTEVAKFTWPGALDQESKLLTLAAQAEEDSFLAKTIAGKKNGKLFHFNTRVIERLLGAPFDDNVISQSTRERFVRICGLTQQRTTPVESKARRAGSSLRATMRTLNLLSLTFGDSIPFFPFPDVQKEDAHFRKVRDRHFESQPIGQPVGKKASASTGSAVRPTANLTIVETASLLSQAVTWTYDYAPAILEVLEFARTELKKHAKDPNRKQATNQTNASIRKKWAEVAERANLPFRHISNLSQGKESLRQRICDLLYSQYVNIGISSGRRPNEICGQGKPYGLYFGALVREDGDIPLYNSEFYIEKSLQEYAVFPANGLMRDSVEVLEKLYVLMREFGERTPIRKSDVRMARRMKLFATRDISFNGFQTGRKTGFDSAKHRHNFLKLANVSAAKFDEKMPPFRRIFATLFMRRYDLREYEALREYLGHLDASTSQGYFSDRGKPRKKGESIRELHALSSEHSAPMIRELKEAGVEYMADVLARMMNGEEVAGLFPRLVLKLLKRLSADVSFRRLGTDRKSMSMAKLLDKRGYGVNPMKHTICTANSPRHTATSAKCFRDGELHREDASETRCSGCIHSLKPNSYVENVREQRDAAVLSRDAPGLPEAVRGGHGRRVIRLTKVIDFEMNMGAKNRLLMEELHDSWASSVAGALHG